MKENEILEYEEHLRRLYFDDNAVEFYRKELEKNYGREFSNSRVDIEKRKKVIWNIVNNENALTFATKLNETKDGFMCPTISELCILEYENIDPLIYDVLINRIYSSPIIARKLHPFLKEYRLTYLVATLFNKNLKLRDDQIEFLNNEIKLCYGFNNHCVSDELVYVKSALEVEQYMLEHKECHGIFPIDIRYWFLNHPLCKDNNSLDKYYKTLIFGESEEINSYYHIEDTRKEYIEFLADAETRVKLRKLEKSHF